MRNEIIRNELLVDAKITGHSPSNPCRYVCTKTVYVETLVFLVR